MILNNLKELVRISWKVSKVFGYNRLAKLWLRENYFQVTLHYKTWWKSTMIENYVKQIFEKVFFNKFESNFQNLILTKPVHTWLIPNQINAFLYAMFVFFSTQPHCCLTFQWIQHQMLHSYCLMHTTIIILRHFIFSILVSISCPSSIYVVSMWSIFHFQPRFHYN